jgi:peptidoglycan hydrolase-like protein with peptidoglycan-binding domain
MNKRNVTLTAPGEAGCAHCGGTDHGGHWIRRGKQITVLLPRDSIQQAELEHDAHLEGARLRSHSDAWTDSAGELRRIRGTKSEVLNRSTRDRVRWLQQSLNQAMQLRLPLDGIMSSATRNAVRRFQGRKGLPVTGSADPATIRALEAARTRSAQHEAETEGFLGLGSIVDRVTSLFTGSSNVTLSGSVGSGGANQAQDVVAVQKLLNRFVRADRLPGIELLKEDGQSGTKTTTAIKAFQRHIMAMNYPDGRVDPGGITLQRLNGPVDQVLVSPSSTLPPPSSTTLKYGVPGGKILSEYLKLRKRGYHTGIDVSTTSATGQGASDPRRGLPVYASLKTSIDIATLNAVQVALQKEPPWKKGLGIPGQGRATLREARVRLRETTDLNNSGYGGTVGLACRYTYTRMDGKSAVFTLFIEYLHLITPACMPYNGTRLITLAEWNSAGKGNRIGFGPKMKNSNILQPEEFATPPLVGYLGATTWPHVHIHANYKEGVHSYLFYPRFDPVVIIK